jgi:peptidoglycan/LPS O-acetylase OafA/YrhL
MRIGPVLTLPRLNGTGVVGHGRQSTIAAVPPSGDSLVRPPTSEVRAAGINGLRALAALSIVAYHCWLYGSPDGTTPTFGVLSWVFPYLALGTTVFLTLSAFLMYHPFAAAIVESRGFPDTRRFLRGRALRIMPAYWVILFITGVALQVALLRDDALNRSIGSLAEHPVLLLENLLLLQNFIPQIFNTGVGPAWYLGALVVFYVALPPLAWLAYQLGGRASSRRGRRLAALTPSALLLLVGVSGKIVSTFVVPPDVGPSPGWDADWHSVLERSFWVQADRFAFGMAVAVLWVEVRNGNHRLPGWWRWACLVAALVIGYPAVRLNAGGILPDYVYLSMAALSVGLVLAAVVVPEAGSGRPSLLARLLDNRVLASVGLISYSLFLWHEPMVYWLAGHGLTLAGSVGFFANFGLVLIISAGLSTITYRYVERPALRFKDSLPLRPYAKRE